MSILKKNKTILSILIITIYLVFILFFSSVSLSFTNFLAFLLVLAIFLLLYKDDLLKDWRSFKKDKKRIKTILFYFLLVLLLSTVVRNVVITCYINLTGSSQIIDSSSKAIFESFNNIPYGTLFVCFLTIIFYPIAEELVFRKSLGDAIKPGILFIIVSSLLSWYFQVTLLNPTGTEFILAIGVLFNSIVTAIIYCKKKNILYTIFPRMLYNLLVCVLQFAYIFMKL